MYLIQSMKAIGVWTGPKKELNSHRKNNEIMKYTNMI